MNIKKVKGRRLKRYFGLKREAKDPGHIEIISPSRIIGWVLSNDINFVEVKLIVGQELIASSPIDISRKDVCDKYGFVGNPGFEIALPKNISTVDRRNKIKLVAISADGKKSQELFLINNEKMTSEVLAKYIYSKVLGMIGNVDGVQSDGLIHGWAGRLGDEEPIDIWIRCETFTPIKLKCDFPRKKLLKVGLGSIYHGFRVKFADLPLDWSNKEIKFSFDREGIFLIPQLDQIIAPNFDSLPKYDFTTSKDEIININFPLINKNLDKDSFDASINEYLNALNKFSKSLDILESEIFRSNDIDKIVKNKKNNWLQNLFRK